MGLAADAWAWIDSNLAGGLLPGGVDVTEPGSTIAGVVPTPFFGLQPPAQAAAAAATPAAAMMAGAAGPAALQAAMGMPVTARVNGAPRGRIVTAVARVMPNGTMIPVRMLPGRPLVTSADLATVKRVKKTARKLARAFPKPKARRRSYRSRPRAHTHAKK